MHELIITKEIARGAIPGSDISTAAVLSSPRDTYHGDSVVQQTLAEHDDVQDLVHVDFLEDGQHGDGIDGADQRGEQEHLQQRGFETEKPALTQHPQRRPYEQSAQRNGNVRELTSNSIQLLYHSDLSLARNEELKCH